MLDLLNSTAWTVLGASTSWAELIGAILGVAMVLCNIRQIHWGWPLAFLSSVLYGLVFAQVRLFAEASLQIVFALTALWGWWQWLGGNSAAHEALRPRRLPLSIAIYLAVLCVALTAATAAFLIAFTSSDLPLADASVTALSLAATYLLGKKYTANWPLWIVVNVLSVILFTIKGLWLTALLYALFGVMAAVGWRTWINVQRQSS